MVKKEHYGFQYLKVTRRVHLLRINKLVANQVQYDILYNFYNIYHQLDSDHDILEQVVLYWQDILVHLLIY